MRKKGIFTNVCIPSLSKNESRQKIKKKKISLSIHFCLLFSFFLCIFGDFTARNVFAFECHTEIRIQTPIRLVFCIGISFYFLRLRQILI